MVITQVYAFVKTHRTLKMSDFYMSITSNFLIEKFLEYNANEE